MSEVVLSESLKYVQSKKDSSIELVYIDPPFFTQKDHGDFDDHWEDLDEYLDFLQDHFFEFHRVLSDAGNLIVHVDWRTSHYLKVGLDSVFGYGNFQAEIVWSYSSGGASKRRLSRKHDTLLWYSKSDAYTFNPQREPYATPNVANRPGFHPEGRLLTDVWPISIISTTGSERVGYATQKPLALLNRVVSVFSNDGDRVLDCFCGSGTTGVACQNLHRDFYLCDSNPDAVRISKKRLGLA